MPPKRASTAPKATALSQRVINLSVSDCGAEELHEVLRRSLAELFFDGIPDFEEAAERQFNVLLPLFLTLGKLLEDPRARLEDYKDPYAAYVSP